MARQRRYQDERQDPRILSSSSATPRTSGTPPPGADRRAGSPRCCGMLRVAYPHPSFPERPTSGRPRRVQDADADRPARRRAGRPGRARRRRLRWRLSDAEATAERRADRDSAFFKLVHATTVVALYDDHEVWDLLGYEGPSFDKGGYLHRGFDDLDWLPRPASRGVRRRAAGRARRRARRDRAEALNSMADRSSTTIRSSSSSAPAPAAAPSPTSSPRGRQVRRAGSGPAPDRRRLRERRVARRSARWPGWTCGPPAVRGGWRRTSRTCPPGSSRRSAAPPPTGPARRPRFMAHEFRARSVYGEHRRRQPAGLADHPRRDGALVRQGGERHRVDPSARPAGAAGQQQLQGVRQRRRAGRLPATTPPGRTARTPSRTTADRPRSRTASTSRATRAASKWSTAVREIPRALATGNLDLRPECQAVKITHDDSGKVDARRVPRRGRATCTGRPREWCAWPATRSSRRGCC